MEWLPNLRAQIQAVTPGLALGWQAPALLLGQTLFVAAFMAAMGQAGLHGAVW